MNPTQARRLIRRLASAGRWRFTGYSLRRLLDRGVSESEVLAVLISARDCAAQANGRWKLSGEDLTVVVEVLEGVVVVTLFRGDEDDDKE